MPQLTSLPELKFKGERTYLHGTDLFQAVTETLGQSMGGYLKELSFRLFGDRQCAIRFAVPDDPDTRIICQGRWHDLAGDDIRFWVVEQDGMITKRYPFDEDRLCAGAHIDHARITARFDPAWSMIENIVALTKKLHNEELPVPDGKWVFGQIVLNERLPARCEQIEIQNYQNIKNRFSRNRILLDANLTGEIRFIVS